VEKCPAIFLQEGPVKTRVGLRRARLWAQALALLGACRERATEAKRANRASRTCYEPPVFKLGLCPLLHRVSNNPRPPFFDLCRLLEVSCTPHVEASSSSRRRHHTCHYLHRQCRLFFFSFRLYQALARRQPTIPFLGRLRCDPISHARNTDTADRVLNNPLPPASIWSFGTPCGRCISRSLLPQARPKHERNLLPRGFASSGQARPPFLNHFCSGCVAPLSNDVSLSTILLPLSST
jgi:hypothetical protein